MKKYKNTSYDQGPWENAGDGRVNMAGTDYAIAQTSRTFDTGKNHRYKRKDDAIIEANADLIAAAPDLVMCIRMIRMNFSFIKDATKSKNIKNAIEFMELSIAETLKKLE